MPNTQIAFIQPSLIGYGGLEKYGMDVVQALASSYQVEVVCGHHVEAGLVEQALGVNLSGVSFRHDPRCRASLGLPSAQRRQAARAYTELTSEYAMVIHNNFQLPEVCGSRCGILLNHSAATYGLKLTPSYPRDLPGICWLTRKGRTQRDIRTRIQSWKQVVTNSQFTQKWFQNFWKRDSAVIYPAVGAVERTEPGRKENWIVSCGFFSGFRTAEGGFHFGVKRQDVLIKAFQHFLERASAPWELHLAGHVDSKDDVALELVEHLRKEVAGLPVSIHLNLPHQQLLDDLFSRSRLYWQASGYGRDVASDPGWAESFGMATVEAMTEGVVPLAYDEGGPVEILDFDRTLLWRNLEDLVDRSLELGQSENRLHLVSEQCRRRAGTFSRDRFDYSWLQLIGQVSKTSECRV